MQEIVGRLTALDPEASEALKVVAYFDTLVTAGAGIDALLRGAAVLSGAVAGAERRGRISRRAPDGREPTTEPHPPSPERTFAAGRVWLERVGARHANDEIIVERLAFALDVLEARHPGVSELEIVLDAQRTLAERNTALAKLHLDPSTRIRIVATRPESRATSASTAVLPTRYGIMRATLQRAVADPPSVPAGLGTWVRADHAPESWEGAVLALKLTHEPMPVIDATDMGALVLLGRVHDPESPHEDVRTLAGLDQRSAQVLRVLVESDSLRSAAAMLGVHHSTIQARHEALVQELGYDPRTPGGKVRYAAAEFLLLLTDTESGERLRPHWARRGQR